jgi:predicted transcriptional regulator
VDLAAVVKEVAKEVAAVAVAATIPAPVLAHSAAIKSKKLITKTTICCVVTCTKMAKSVPVDNLAIVLSTNVK